MLNLRIDTDPEWTRVALADFDAFLADHAACERKASATAMSFVSKYRDKPELVAAMIDLAVEELEHFQRVYQVIAARGGMLAADEKDAYVGGLAAQVRTGAENYFLDRLLIGGIIEARGTERFGLIAQALEPGPLKEMYLDLTRAEARHHGLFVRLAKVYRPAAEVDARLAELLDAEATIVAKLPLRPAVH